ncbi:MAG TPA: PAS domain-containing protein [Kofleriaceae bacterium]|nr:PAS domain-containing protein [Kofleriaceae bacterium]
MTEQAVPSGNVTTARAGLADHAAAVLDAVADGITVEDAAGNIVYANTAAAELRDLSRLDLFSTDGATLSPRELPSRYVLAGEPSRELVVKFRVKDTGVERWSLVRSNEMRGPAGERWAVNTFRDITAQKAAEDVARENGRRLELALAAGKMGVFEWDIAANRVYWSPELEAIHGMAPGTFDGTVEMYRRDMHPVDRERVIAATKRTLERKAPHYLNYRILRPDGTTRWIEAHGQLELDTAGNPVRLVGISRDITEHHEGVRARIDAILDSITDPFTILDRDLRVVHVNKTAARLSGRSPEELAFKHLEEISPTAKESPFWPAYQKVLETKAPLHVEEYIAAMDRWFEANIYPIDDGIGIYHRDVTMRKRALELTTRLARHSTLRADVAGALAEERDVPKMLQRCCQLLVEHLDVAFARVWTVDDVGTTLMLQASAGMYTHTNGPHRAVPVGKFKIGRIAASRKPHLTNDVAHDTQIGDPQWAAREQMVSFAGYPLLVDGKLVGVMAMFAKHAMPDDTMSALGGIADVIAQGVVRRHTELELEQKVAELARSNADLEQFAYVASHDLQEPLRMVASYNQLLARRYKGKLGEDADEFIAFTVEGVTRMQRLINDLLAYSRVGTRGSDRVEVDMEKLLRGALQNLERALIEADAQVTHDPLPTITADEGQMLQLVQNLVGNAVKFHGDAKPSIHIGVVNDAKGVTFSVRDNGIGIDPQYFERIFVIFQRLNPREKYPGTGIGLAICKKIVERHGGRIWVESAPGAGSTIFFTIPHQRRAQ